LNWNETDLKERSKNHPHNTAMADRVRRETTLMVRQIAQRLHMGSWKSLNNKSYLRRETGIEEAKSEKL